MRAKIGLLGFMLCGLGVLSTADATTSPSVLGTWDGRWDYYPVACGGASCPGPEYFENFTFTSQTPDGGDMFNVLGSSYECGPVHGCVTFSWDSGMLVGNQLTLLTDATSANDYEGYELIVDLTNSGNSLAGNLTQGGMDGAFGWVPVGTGYGFTACPDTGCTSGAQTANVVAEELATTADSADYYPESYMANRVPEPGTLGLMSLLLLAGVGIMRRNRSA
ncbi:MAG TPA: PEP-CTERM sorting domain-containing protein [Steroidobacteraceae bacterium]|nr:PEP-CTERM sorting domain-containing protein [Steroidobacteraceae bacterium]